MGRFTELAQRVIRERDIAPIYDSGLSTPIGLAAVRTITGLDMTDPIPKPKAAAPARPVTPLDLAADYERRFGQSHARLFPWLGRRVQTPDGPGVLIQVFAGRACLDLGDVASDGTRRVRFYAPGEIEGIQ